MRTKRTEDRGRLRPWAPATYRIEVDGELNETSSDLFAAMRVTTRSRPDRSVITCLKGRVLDQSELTGLLDGLAELHLPILQVLRIDEDDEGLRE